MFGWRKEKQEGRMLVEGVRTLLTYPLYILGVCAVSELD